MQNINKEHAVRIQLVTFALLWMATVLLTTTDQPLFNVDALKKLPTVISAYAVLHYIFVKWVWKWKWLQGWLIPYPNLQGTWRGELISSWVNPETKEKIAPIPFVFVIRQTFYEIKCSLYTKESESHSRTAQIVEEDNALRLVFNYANVPKPSVRDRSTMHYGAASLKIVRVPTSCLEGEYWTSRKTDGEMVLEYASSKLEEKFTPKES